MSTSTSETVPETKPKTPRKRAPRKTTSKVAPIKTVKRKIGDETHDWSNELGGIVRPFGPAKASKEQSEPVIVEETPAAPRAGKVPVDPLGEIALSEGDKITS